MNQPSGGFSDGNIAHLFSPNQSPISNGTAGNHTSGANGSDPSTTATPASSTGAIAGGVVGGIAGLALIALGIFLFRRRRNRQKLAEAGVHYEVGGQPLVEKEGSAPRPDGEMMGDTQYPPAFPPAELPGGPSTHYPHELSPANYTRETK